jgi:tetratricopeptide (TPR) repeat protein
VLRDNLSALFQLYVRPAAALGQILDRGRLWFAIVAALGVSLLLHLTDSVQQAVLASPGFSTVALLRFISYEPGSYLAPLLAVGMVLVPAIVLSRAVAGFGSFGVLMRSDYSPLLICTLMCWAAGYLPLALARLWIDNVWLYQPSVYLASDLYFLVLAAFGVRAVFGTGLGPAIGMALVGWIAGVLGAGLFGILGSFVYYLASPLFLYFLYYMFQNSDLRSFGEGLRSRQHFQQQLEISTTNPHDADAHYQLGLIYQKRRQYSDAIARFERAVEIDPEESDAHFQLGRIAREQGRFEDAIRHLKDAAALDDKLALSDVWRELGASYLGAGRVEEALGALTKYIDRRPYDPEGLYWFGETLLRLDRRVEARSAFERCIEAVDTIPSNRRAQVRKWRSLAQASIK